MIEQVGAPDILVNNAAVTFLRPLDEFPEKRVRLMLEMHVLAPLHLTQLAMPGDARAPAGLGAHDDVGRRRPHRRPAVLGVRPHGGLRRVRHREGRHEPADPEPRRRALRRRHRGQRGGAVESGGDPGRRHARPGEDRHRGHQLSSPRPRSACAPATRPRSPGRSSTRNRSCAKWVGSRVDARLHGLPCRASGGSTPGRPATGRGGIVTARWRRSTPRAPQGG